MIKLKVFTLLGLGGMWLATGCSTHTTVYVPPPAVAVQPAPAGPMVPPPAGPEVTVAPSAPPVPQVEVIPANPNPTFVWVPGYWNWNGGWIWVHGYWGPHPRYYHAWAPGRWGYYRGHYVWRRGYWH
jgi:hypothetical protein